MKLTPCFSADNPPVRVGYYCVWWYIHNTREVMPYPHYCYWNGSEWFNGCVKLATAIATQFHQRPQSHFKSPNFVAKWCGVLKE